jgi:hypothetical protein
VAPAATTSSTAATATQRSCWRSTPWARRKRATSDPAQTATARVVKARASWLTTSSTPPWPPNSKGLPSTWTDGSTDPGARVTSTTSSSGTATMALAHHRQRGEGSDPVGVNSRTKPSRSSPHAALAA